MRRRKRSIQHGSSDWRERTTADALQDPEADQQGEVRSQAAQGRRYAEEGQRQQEYTPGAPVVTQPSRSWDDGCQADQISNYDRVESDTANMIRNSPNGDDPASQALLQQVAKIEDTQKFVANLEAARDLARQLPTLPDNRPIPTSSKSSSSDALRGS